MLATPTAICALEQDFFIEAAKLEKEECAVKITAFFSISKKANPQLFKSSSVWETVEKKAKKDTKYFFQTSAEYENLF